MFIFFRCDAQLAEQHKQKQIVCILLCAQTIGNPLCCWIFRFYFKFQSMVSKEISSCVHLIVFLIYHVICYTRKKKHRIISFSHLPVYLVKHLQTKSHQFRRKSPTPSENYSHIHSISIPAKTMTNPFWPDPSLWLSSCPFQPFQVFYYFTLLLVSFYLKKKKNVFLSL